MKIIYREMLGIFLLRHAVQRLVKCFRGGGDKAIRICAFPDDQIGRDIAVSGTYEPAGLAAIKWLIKAGIINSTNEGIFLDVGANVGLYSLQLAQNFKRVMAFEPHPITKKILDLNVEINTVKNVSVSEYALSDKNGKSLLVDNVDNAGAASLGKSFSADDVCYTVDVRLASEVVMELNEFHLPISFIKIDVEGHELQVLKGLRSILIKDFPVIAFEANNDSVNSSIIPLLKGIGYTKFIAIDFLPAISPLFLRVMILSLLGVRYTLRPVEKLKNKNYSLVFALSESSSQIWESLEG